ncbi:MAG: hypothetical protein KBS59_07225, partial [Clostridiales bacterium]|nr:hypothetical protein [Clostridiales bacterium]
YTGDCEYVPAYIRPRFEMDGLYDSAYVIFQQSANIEATGEVVADMEKPYFNRTTFHFSSHKHTPNDPTSRYPAATVGADGGYVSFPLFSEYATYGSLISKRVIEHMIDILLGDEKTLTTNLMAQGITTVMHQKDEHRFVNHLIYVSPVKRGNKIEIVEDIVPVYDIEVSLKLGVTPKRVHLAPENKDIDFDCTDGVITYTVDKIYCHQMVVIEY